MGEEGVGEDVSLAFVQGAHALRTAIVNYGVERDSFGVLGFDRSKQLESYME